MTQQNAPVLDKHEREVKRLFIINLWEREFAQALANLEAARAESADLRGQIDKLAHFIMANVPGEPSRSEGAIDCAIRVIEAANNRLAEIDRIAREQAWHHPSIGSEGRNKVAALASGHTPSPCPDFVTEAGTEFHLPKTAPCPGCAAKDEAMAEIAAICSDDGMDFAEQVDRIEAIAARFIIPPADPVAEALNVKLTDLFPEWDTDQRESIASILAAELSRLPLGGAK